MQRTTTSPDDYLASLPDDVREDMIALDAAIAPVFAGHERVLWEGVFWGGTEQRIIGYGDLRQRNSKGAEVEWFAVGLAAQKSHLSLYVSVVDDGQYILRRYCERLGKVKCSNANVTFKRLSDLDLPVAVEMVTRARDGWLAGSNARA
jgi:phage FluMu protein gp41